MPHLFFLVTVARPVFIIFWLFYFFTGFNDRIFCTTSGRATGTRKKTNV